MNEECFPFRPLLAERLLLGQPLPDALARHLDRCPDCAREASEFGDVVRTLRRADPDSDWTAVRAAERPSPELGERIRWGVAEATPTGPRRGRRIGLAVTAVAAAVIAAVAVLPSIGEDQERQPAQAIELVREGPMVSRPGGTEVPVALSGLRAGEDYRMMTVNAAGARTPGGSVRAATGEPVSTRMVTAMHRDTITALIVEDEAGQVVIHIPVAPPPPT